MTDVQIQDLPKIASQYAPPQDELSTIRSEWFNWVMDDAYRSKRGYSISTNPFTGEKVMVVAGTRNARDWLANLYEMSSPRAKRLQRYAPHKYREHYQKFLSDLAKKNHVQAIYGHSRGGAIVNDMDFSGRKVGVDAAGVLTFKRRDKIDNYRTDSYFDRFVGGHTMSIDVGPVKYRPFEFKKNHVTKAKEYIFKYNPKAYHWWKRPFNPKFHRIYRTTPEDELEYEDDE